MKIWGRRAAINVQKVLWCADELSLQYEQVDAGGHYGVNKEEFFLELNPNGRVPVMELDGFILWESNAIIRYLCRKFNQNSIGGATPEDWSNQDKWMDWTASSLYYSAFRNYYLYNLRTPEGEANPQIKESLRTDVVAILQIMNSHLAHSRYVCGDTFSMADFHLGVIVDKWERMDRGESKLNNLSRYYEELLLRPHYNKNVANLELNAV